MKHLRRLFSKQGLLTLITVGALITLMPYQNAKAASGQTNVTINFPDTIILHLINDLELISTLANDNSTYVEAGTSESDTADLATPTFANVGLTTVTNTLSFSGTTNNVTVKKIWGVRSPSSTGNLTVTAKMLTPDATKSGTTSTVTMEALKVTDGTSTATNIIVSAPGLAANTALIGDIVFALNISGVTESGNHTGMVYQITATAP